MDDVVAELHVLDALRREQCQSADRPSRLASAGKNRQPGCEFEGPLKSYGALDVCAVRGTKRRLDIAADLVQRQCDCFDLSVIQMRVLSYFADGDAASRPNCAV